MDLYTDVADQYRDFAAYAHGESSCFEDWALRVADDEQALAWIAGLPPVKQQPNLVFAAARWHGVPAPGPYAGLSTALLGDDGAIRATILARSTQTNEVGRLATLVPAFSTLQRESGRPLVLLEVGASAGLCLYPDRFDYAWETRDGVVRANAGPRAGDAAATLACRVDGDAPLPVDPPEVTWRGGLDLNPLDVRDEDAMAWLATLVWPEQEERRQRLKAAVRVATQDPPALRRADLLTGLPALLEGAGRHGEVVVFHSAVVAYLEPGDRDRFDRTMRTLVDDGACRWVSNEAPRVLPTVSATAPPPPPGRFVLAVDGRAVAWTHPHGRSLTWL